MSRTFTAYIQLDSESGLYLGFVPGLVGAQTQGASLDELQQNLREVLELVLEERAAQGESIESERFVGIHQITLDCF